MKKTILILVSCLALSLSASADQKIATIDLRKVFDKYWRTIQADANLKGEAGELEKESKAMIEQLRKNEEKYRKLVEGANDQSLSQSERDKRKKEAENELLGLREGEAKIKQYDNTARTTLAEKQRRMRDNILQEIRETVKARVKTGGYTLVVDTAAETMNGTPIVLYSAGTDDLTDSVLSTLNINAPPPPAGKTDAK
jgi:Skp family chaperone for outer membrane proteins